MKDYYSMTEAELDSIIADMKLWLFRYGGHDKWWDVWYALEVACNAREVHQDRILDPFLDEIILTFK